MPTRVPELLDRRSLRFAALLGRILLGVALALGPIDGLALVAAQMFVFATGAIMGPRHQPFVALYRRTVGRRGAPATRLVPAPAEQFGQTLGLLATFVALMGGVLNATGVFTVFTAVALAGTLIQVLLGSNPLGSLLARIAGRAAGTVRVVPGTAVDDADDAEADGYPGPRAPVDLTEDAAARTLSNR